jgi:hypothetical protein
MSLSRIKVEAIQTDDAMKWPLLLAGTIGWTVLALASSFAVRESTRRKVYAVPPYTPMRSQRLSALHETTSGDSDGSSPSEIGGSDLPLSRRRQEKSMERISQIGADKIATLSIPERTKRAMLAEAIEDEMFVATEQLEDLYQGSDDDNSLSDQNRGTARELTQRIASLQSQYNELVSGRSSSVLNVLESAIGDEPDSNDTDSGSFD